MSESTAKLIDGKIYAERVRADVAAQVAELKASHGLQPGLAVVLVGDDPASQTPAQTRFKGDSAAKAVLANTVRLDGLTSEDFDAVFYPGGHGPLWDLAEDPASIKLIESFVAAGKTFALVCHSSGALPAR